MRRAGEVDDEGPALELARLQLANGGDLDRLDGLPLRARRAVEIAHRAGADAAVALDAAIAAEADAAEAERAIEVATAQTRSVAVGLLLAPLLLVPGLGRLLDVDLVAFYAQPIGWVVAAVALTLGGVGAGGIWALLRQARRGGGGSGSMLPALVVAGATAVLLTWWLAPLAAVLVARRSRVEATAERVDEAVDLVATALGAGSAPAQAVRDVAMVRDDLGSWLGPLAFDLERGRPGPALPAPLDRLATLLHAADEAGTPAEQALRRLATQLRADERARALAAAERLPAQLTFPTAMAMLPAVLLTVGAPIVHAGLSVAAGA